MATILFVHGAFQGGWVWNKILPLIEAFGHTAYCPTLTGLGNRHSEIAYEIGLSNHITNICDVIDAAKLSNIILVGHSYGGMVISGVAKLRSNKLSQLIYLDAPIPDNNQSLFDVLGPEAKSNFIALAVKDGNGWLVPSFSPKAFGLDDKEVIAWAFPQHTPQSLKCFSDKVSTRLKDEAPHLECNYIRCTFANSFNMTQAEKAKMRGWKNFEIAAPHCPMITHPQLLSDLLCEEIF